MLLATYGPVQGDYELRVEIANYLNEHQKLVTDPSQLLITSGAQQGIDLIAQTLLKPGDTVLVESPCYSARLMFSSIKVFKSFLFFLIIMEFAPT